MTTLVCIPYFGVPDLVERCVRSVLAQSLRDIVVLVIGDGEAPPLDVRDDRLAVYVLPENRGPYFAQQLAILASPFDRYAVVGADDWVEPEHLERLAGLGGTAAIVGWSWFHFPNGRVMTVHKGLETGLYSTNRLRNIGGHNPAERIGQDSLLIHLLRQTGDLRATDQPTYHRVVRPGSLSRAPETKRGSDARNEMRAHNRAVLRQCLRLGRPNRIREYRDSLVPAEVRDELAEHVERLSGVLGRQAVAA